MEPSPTLISSQWGKSGSGEEGGLWGSGQFLTAQLRVTWLLSSCVHDDSVLRAVPVSPLLPISAAGAGGFWCRRRPLWCWGQHPASSTALGLTWQGVRQKAEGRQGCFAAPSASSPGQRFSSLRAWGLHRLSPPALCSQHRLSPPLSHLKMLADWKPRRQPLPFCCNWKLPSGFLLWRHRSVNDRKVRPGPWWKRLFLRRPGAPAPCGGEAVAAGRTCLFSVRRCH